MTKISESQVRPSNRAGRPIQSPSKVQKGGSPKLDAIDLKTDDVVKGKILRTLTGNKVLVSAAGKQFVADAQTPLRENETRLFQVLAVRPQILLKVLDAPSSEMPSALQIWSGSRSLPEQFVGTLKEILSFQNLDQVSHDFKTAFEALRGLISNAIYDPLEADGGLLSQNLLSCGIFLENKIARHLLDRREGDLTKIFENDLKGLLCNLAKKLNGEDFGEREALASKLQHALDFLQREQRLNLSTLREGLGWYWFLPGWEEDGHQKTELYGQRDDEEDRFRLCIRLDLTYLGETEVNVSFVKSSLNVSILMKEAEAMQLVEDHLDELKLSLNAAGLEVGSLSCGKREGEFVPPFHKTNEASTSVHVII